MNIQLTVVGKIIVDDQRHLRNINTTSPKICFYCGGGGGGGGGGDGGDGGDGGGGSGKRKVRIRKGGWEEKEGGFLKKERRKTSCDKNTLLSRTEGGHNGISLILRHLLLFISVS